MELKSKYYLSLAENLQKYDIPAEAMETAQDSIQFPEESTLSLLFFLIT
ncbi:MAG: hypothetical protein GX922_05825 [Firmicutes bacterium]|jgi:hypothetical protein|nr:hypothetical protein [Bacillota bacterium]